MKTSKIIFISFFGVIGLFLLSLLIQVDPHKYEKDHVQDEIFDLPVFNHLVVENGSNVTLIQDSADSIKLTLEKGVIITKPAYSLKGDTLVVSHVANKDYCFIEIHFQNMESIQASNCFIYLNKISAKSLLVHCSGVQIDMREDVEIDSLNIELSYDSQLWCSDSKLKTVNLTADKSNADFSVDQIAELKAELRDNSELSTWKVLQSNVTSDETSRYYSR